MAGTSNSVVMTIDSWQQLIDSLKGNVVVLEFMAPWSEPSKFMEQPFKEVASEFKDKNSNVKFAALNFDNFKNLGRRLQVEALPTFLVVNNFAVVDRILALSKTELQQKINDKLKLIN
uniref:Thioredoxin domain-containing protein n=1 Tax=Oryza glumipatula TaxID=40148 RepID=A0A0E0B6M6_9ORYZ